MVGQKNDGPILLPSSRRDEDVCSFAYLCVIAHFTVTFTFSSAPSNLPFVV